jgi:hypothetical protein
MPAGNISISGFWKAAIMVLPLFALAGAPVQAQQA